VEPGVVPAGVGEPAPLELVLGITLIAAADLGLLHSSCQLSSSLLRTITNPPELQSHLDNLK